MPRLNEVQRLRMVLALIKDGTVPDVTAYDDVELFDPVKTSQYVDAMIGDGPIDTEEWTNEQKAKFVLDRLKDPIRGALRRKKTDEATRVARAAVEAELEADFADDVEE